MAVKRYGVQNPNANTEVTLLTTNDPLLISVIATNKHASADADINVFVIPNGATQPSEYAYIAYNLQVNPGNSVETHRFAVNAGDTVKVSSSISDVSFTGSGIPQTDILPADEVQVFTNKTISGLSNTLTNIGNSSLTNSQITLMGEQMDLGETVANLDYFQFDTASTPASAVGRLTWDDGEGTISLGLKGGNLNLEVGQENIALCYNGTGSQINKGSVVYISGAQGQRPSIALADADTEATSSKTFGIVAENIANGAEGFVATFGVVPGLNTSGFTEGQALWLSSTAGQLTNVKPTQPVHSVFIGYCLSVNEASGRIFVNPQNGYELDELHNVLISSPSNGQALVYDSTTQLWKNTSVDSLPSQTGNSGKYLTTNGTTASWATIDLSSYATQSYVDTSISNLIDAAPTALNTLNELAAALNDDANFSTTVTNALSNKEPSITSGTTSQYWRGDKSWQTLDKNSVGLGNVENTALSTWTGSSSITTVGTLTNLTVTNTINGSISGNSATVTNGVYTTGSYSNPSWITSLSETKVLPSQTGNSGKYLTTNGTSTSWGDIAGAVYSADAPISPSIGQLWIESDVDVSAYSVYQRWSRTLTGSETVFTGLEGTQILSYPAGLEQVYLNGVLLVRGTDYTGTNGSTITLTSAGQSGDVIEILSPNTFASASYYTKTEIDLLLTTIDGGGVSETYSLAIDGGTP